MMNKNKKIKNQIINNNEPKIINLNKWFPGHIKKTLDELVKIIKLCDFIIVVVDARAINLTFNNCILNLANNKPIIKVASKSDLADLDHYKSDDVLYLNLKSQNARQILLNKINNVKIPIVNKMQAKGYSNVCVRSLVVGLPNLGKSTLINLLVKKKVTLAANKPGITKHIQWLKVDNNLELWDSPGILPKSIESIDELYTLATLNIIDTKSIFISDLSSWLFVWINKYYKKMIERSYNIKIDNFQDFCNYICDKYSFKLKGNINDLNRCYSQLLQDFSSGKNGVVSFDNQN